MSLDEIVLNAWNRKVVRDFCNLMCIPSIFDCLEVDKTGKCIGNFKDGFKVNQKYIDGKNKADAMFEEIMKSPEKIKETVDCYYNYLRRKRIEGLESELQALKEEENV